MNAPMNMPKGRRRKFWSWGYEGQDIPESEVKSMHERVAKRLGMSDFTVLPDPTLDEIEIRAPRPAHQAAGLACKLLHDGKMGSRCSHLRQELPRPGYGLQA